MQNVNNLVSLEALTRRSLKLTYAANRPDGNAVQVEQKKAKKGLQAQDVAPDRPRQWKEERGKGKETEPAVQQGANEQQWRKKKANKYAQNAATPANLAYHKKEGTNLKIRTQDGDVVKLSFTASDTMKAKVDPDGGKLVGELQLSSSVQQKISVTVRGDLSDEEAEAIRSVLEQVGELADDFFSNDIAGAFETASAFQVDGEQLARVNLNLHVQERVTYGPGKGSRASHTDKAPEEATLPKDSTQSSDDISVAASGEQPPLPAVEEGVEEDLPVPPKSLFEALANLSQFLQRLLDKLDVDAEEDESEEGTTSPYLQFSFKVEVFGSIVQSAAEAEQDEESEGEEAPKQPLPSLVNETLAALAGERRLSVDAIG